MKWLKIISTCLSLIIFPVLIESCGCDSGDCGCDANWDTAFSINSLSISHGTREPIPGSTNGGLQSKSSPDITKSVLSKYSIVVSMDAKYRHALLEHPKATMAAYACSPPAPLGDQWVTSILITSDQPLTNKTDLNYIAGDELNAIFLVETQGGMVYTTIDEFIGSPLYEDTFSLVSEFDVDAAQHHKFTVTIELSDGRIFTLATKDIELIPKS